MRLLAMLLIWPGLALLWLGVAVLPWGWAAFEDVDTLVEIGNLIYSVPGANQASFPDPLIYVGFGFMVPHVLTSIVAPLLPARAKAARIVAGVLYSLVAVGLLVGLATQWSALDGEESQVAVGLAVLAVVLLAVALGYFTDRIGPVAVLTALLAFAGAIWTGYTLISLWLDAGGMDALTNSGSLGLPGPGAMAVLVGYLLVTAGAVSVLFARRRVFEPRADQPRGY